MSDGIAGRFTRKDHAMSNQSLNTNFDEISTVLAQPKKLKLQIIKKLLCRSSNYCRYRSLDIDPI